MKLVVTDGYTINPGDLSWEPLKEFGELVVFDHSPVDEDEMIRRIGDADILVANKAKVSRRVIDACPNLKFITIQAAGYDAIDYQYAKEKGIPLSNVPDYGSAAVAQYAIALLLEICGSVGHHVEAVRQGRWAESGEWCFWDYPMIELAGKTIDPQKPHEVDQTRRPDQKTTRDQKPQIRPHKNHTRTTKTKNAQNGL